MSPLQQAARVAKVAVLPLLAVALLVMAPAAGSRSSTVSNVYISYPTWYGNCPGGGSVTGIYAASGILWSTSPGGDWGDDLIYPKVDLYTYNTISAKLYCRRPWYRGGGYWGPAVSATIYPTRGGQTFWVGPLGQQSRN